MKQYTLEKEFITELHQNLNDEYKLKLEEKFPDIFPKKLEVGKWYKHSRDGDLFFINEISESACHGYGFRHNGIWFNQTKGNYIFCAVNHLHFQFLEEATDKEVEEALIAEAKKRYNIPCNISYLDGRKGTLQGLSLYLNKEKNALSASGHGECDFLFQKGIWAEILPETKIISMEKAVKILSKKFKQTVEIK